MNESDIRAIVAAEVAAALSGVREAARTELAWGVPGRAADAMSNGDGEYAGKGVEPDRAGTPTGEAGMRVQDAWTWRHAGGGSVTIGNVWIGLRGVVAEYTGGNVAVGSATYVYAEVTWTLDEDKNVTGIESVSVAGASSFADASKSVEDNDGNQTGVRVPLGLFKYASGAWGDTLLCQRRYFGGAVMLDPGLDAKAMTCDSFIEAETLDQESVETVALKGTDINGREFYRYFQLVNFDTADDYPDAAVLTAADAGWTDPTTGATSQKMLVRKVIANGQVRLHYKSFHPVPSGDATNVALKWDTSSSAVGWKAALPIETTNDEQSDDLVDGSRVVTGAKTGSSGNLIQLITKPLKMPDREAGVLAIVSVKSFAINGSKIVLTFGTANTITGEAGDDITKEINGSVENIIQSVDYDGSVKKFTQTVKSALVLGGGTATDSDIVSLVSHASQHTEG